MLNCQDSFLNKVNDLAFKFVWNQKPDKVKRTVLIAEYADGGLKMLDIKEFVKAQKAMWVKRLLSDQIASWKVFPRLALNKILGLHTLQSSLNTKTNKYNLPEFYWQMLKCWIDIRNINKKLITSVEIRKEYLWYNENIKIQKKTSS
jgi:hypothetical protein